MPVEIAFTSYRGSDELDGSHWSAARVVTLSKYWSGDDAPAKRHAEARILWSERALHVRFDASQHEPLIVTDTPEVSHKTLGLWDRDVCEIFVAPDATMPERYFEFEAAPTGEWVDLAIDHVDGKRITDTEYSSGMTCSTRIGEGRVIIAMRIPWGAFGRKPSVGDVWLGNLFRCVGSGDDRGYLARFPTFTERPNFHVPAAFGEFRFVG